MKKSKKLLYLIGQNIRSLYNVGSIFRNADAFGVDRIFLGGFTGYPPRKEISKTALGAELSVPWERHWQTHEVVRQLKQAGFQIVALELTKRSLPLNKFKPRFPLALIVGNEKQGVSAKVLKMCDQRIYIPMQGIKESLNVAVACGVALYQLRYR
jgi:tRNA G18 (ribose-2'-O)-methylase SpoU